MAYRQFGPLEAMMHVQQQGEMGRQRGEQTRLGRLVSQGMSEPGGLSRIAPEVAKIDPNAAFALQDRESASMDKRREALTSRARVLSAMPTQQRAQVWPSIKAELAAVDPELGAALPDMYDEAQFGPVIQQLAGLGGGSELPSEIRTLEYLQRNPELMAINDRFRGQKSFKEVTNPDGTVSYLALDNRSGQGQFAPVGGAQPPQAQPQPQTGNGDPKMDALVQAANAMRAANVPIEQIDAFLMQAAQQTPGVQVGQGAPMQQPLPSINQIGGGIPGAPRGLGQSDADRARAEAQQAAMVEAAKRQTGLQFAGAEAQAEADRARLVKGAEAETAAAAKAKEEITGLRNQQRTITSAIKGLRDGKYKTGPQNLVIPDAFQSADNQVFITTINKAVLDEAAKLTGVISDKDMAFLQAATISMEKWPEANIEILEEVERILSDGIKAKEKLIQGGGNTDSPEDDIDALLAEFGS